MKIKGFGVSPITNTIYYGTQDVEKHMWVGNDKKNVTDKAIAAVFEWFMGMMNDETGNIKEYSITYPNTEYELVMRKKEAQANET